MGTEGLVNFQVGVRNVPISASRAEQERCWSGEALHHLALGTGNALIRSLINLPVVNAETGSSEEKLRVPRLEAFLFQNFSVLELQHL